MTIRDVYCIVIEMKSYEKRQSRKTGPRSGARGIAKVLSRNRPSNTTTEESQTDDEFLLAHAKERKARQEKVYEVARTVRSIVQDQLPDDLPRDEKTKQKRGVHKVESNGKDGQTITFSHFPSNWKLYRSALTTIEIANPGHTDTLELTDNHGNIDMTLTSAFEDGRTERFRTLSDREFALPDEVRVVRGVNDLAELCLGHAEYAQSLAAEPEQAIPRAV